MLGDYYYKTKETSADDYVEYCSNYIEENFNSNVEIIKTITKLFNEFVEPVSKFSTDDVKKDEDDFVQTGNGYSQEGLQLKEQGNYQEALKYILKGTDYIIALYHVDPAFYAKYLYSAYDEIGDCYKELGNIDEAIKNYSYAMAFTIKCMTHEATASAEKDSTIFARKIIRLIDEKLKNSYTKPKSNSNNLSSPKPISSPKPVYTPKPTTNSNQPLKKSRIIGFCFISLIFITLSMILGVLGAESYPKNSYLAYCIPSIILSTYTAFTLIIVYYKDWAKGEYGFLGAIGKLILSSFGIMIPYALVLAFLISISPIIGNIVLLIVVFLINFFIIKKAKR